ncbi:hypothetical protein KQI68_06645 [Peptoniphilus sp. MSJ-1]|uniref:Phage protein, HK97 gp10 family n=1 Tax=Peptoniphilus ovalis TaxID=2841503 RepID=A0ABS6FH69_9FIRM|nr:hypothetical protein [Peptoniphilus ovalis]MBU5669516.1 hypothetical protein [Peptoniphilus ovalis]
MNDNFDLEIGKAIETALIVGRNTWIDKAQKGLKSSREQYIRAISDVYVEDTNSGYIELRGTFPVMIETGFTSFDMKMNFSKSTKKRKGKNGRWYLTIPFRHYTSGTTNVMPSKILKAARKLRNGGVLREAIVRDLGFGPQTSKTGYRWKNSKYDGLRRVVKNYESSTRGYYMTFRRVGSASDPRAFIHPGYKGLHAIEEVKKNAEKAFFDALGD